ncbi:MAG: RNA-binding protein [Rhodospirillales bacterium]|nr:RNA-binding protein [Rhodospirillales bacterium]
MRRADTGDGSSRRCVVTGAVRPIEEMVRFVESPGGEVVPDLERILPGRGIWLSASRDVLNTAVAKGLFSKAARKRLTAPPDLADRVERLLAKRCFDLLGLARRAGQVAAGFEQVRSEARSGRGAVLLEAHDASLAGRAKVGALASGLPVVDLFSSLELGAALGRDATMHVLVGRGRLAARLLTETRRLAGFRQGG